MVTEKQEANKSPEQYLALQSRGCAHAQPAVISWVDLSDASGRDGALTPRVRAAFIGCSFPPRHGF